MWLVAPDEPSARLLGTADDVTVRTIEVTILIDNLRSSVSLVGDTADALLAVTIGNAVGSAVLKADGELAAMNRPTT